LIRDADKLEMIIQAYVYEQSTGNNKRETSRRGLVQRE
jgi:5'-deoxynucleotidase YfbR-like HD superfamily hydrolase